MTIEQRYYEVCQNIEKACDLAGRKREDVTLIAVTKTRTPEEINKVISLGADVIGENRVQELLSKYEQLYKNAQIHLIGQLQTNKVKYIIDKVKLIHSLDRISLATELDKQAKNKLNAPIEALIEVNIGSETTKCGILPENLTEYLDILQNFLYIKPKGLMTVAPQMATEKELEQYFSKMQQFLEKGQAIFGKDFNVLSMGMSRDYSLAIKHGSTMVRIGTALFGERDYNRGI